MNSSPPTTASGYFGGMVDAYDSLIRRAVPRYEEITSTLLHYLPPSVDSGLELGCGTGNLSLRLAARYPNARLTFVDAAPEMTETTQARLLATGADPDRLTFDVARFEELDDPASPYDLVTSTFSLHHVVDKDSLFRRVRRWMRKGGRLCFADQLRGTPAAVHEINWNDWIAFCRLPGHCSDEEVESLVSHSVAHDHYATVAEHIRLMEGAGFEDVDCVWRGGMWGVVTATAA